MKAAVLRCLLLIKGRIMDWRAREAGEQQEGEDERKAAKGEAPRLTPVGEEKTWRTSGADSPGLPSA